MLKNTAEAIKDFGINLDECVSCGAKTGIVTIDGDKGGLVCKNCYQNERIVKSKTIQLLRMYFYLILAQKYLSVFV